MNECRFPPLARVLIVFLLCLDCLLMGVAIGKDIYSVEPAEPVIEVICDCECSKEQPVDIPEEPEVVEPEPVFESHATDDEIDLIALVTMAEAEGEPEEGKRLVIDTILNRRDHEAFPDTIYDVIYQKNQFSSVWGERIKRCYVKDDIRQLVVEELQSRTNHDCVFFRAGKYGKYGTPMFSVGNHYFSKY